MLESDILNCENCPFRTNDEGLMCRRAAIFTLHSLELVGVLSVGLDQDTEPNVVIADHSTDERVMAVARRFCRNELKIRLDSRLELSNA